MEELEITLSWTPTVLMPLETLRPLSPELFDETEFKELADLGFNVEKLSRSEIAGKLLDHLDGLKKEEPEPFDWFATEKSIDLPLFDSVPSPLPPPQHCNRLHTNVKHLHNYSSFPQAENVKNEQQYAIQQQQLQQQQQQEYLYDALPLHPSSSSSYSSVSPSPGDESSCSSSSSSSDASLTAVPLSPASNATEWLKAETLTPPDSPKDEEILKLLREFQPGELEQLVMARVEDEFPSSLTGSPCSMSDDYLDSGASSPFVGSDSGMEDPEWTPPRRARTLAGGSKRTGSYGEMAAATMMMPSTAVASSSSRKRSKPYAKPAVEERKMRKKEQNKNAATRYRLKKKAEVEEVRFEERQLEEKNKLLRNQLEDISREVKYLKSLMRDVYRKKGLIK